MKDHLHFSVIEWGLRVPGLPSLTKLHLERGCWMLLEELDLLPGGKVRNWQWSILYCPLAAHAKSWLPWWEKEWGMEGDPDLLPYLTTVGWNPQRNPQHFQKSFQWSCAPVDLSIPQNYWKTQLFHFRKFIDAHKNQGYTHISLKPGTNPRQSGLPTALNQTSIFWKLAAAEGDLPAFQKFLTSQHILVLHFQDTAARWNGSGMLSVPASHIEN